MISLSTRLAATLFVPLLAALAPLSSGCSTSGGVYYIYADAGPEGGKSGAKTGNGGTGGGGTQTGGGTTGGGTGGGTTGGGTGGGTGGSTTCAPGSVSGYTSATYKPPSGKSQNKCNMQLVSDCFTLTGTSAQQACDSAFGSTTPNACGQCVFTPSTAAKWGPVISSGQDNFVNANGCLDLLYGGSLGKKKADRDGCYQFACDDNCPFTDPANPTSAESADYEACAQTAIADAAICKTYQAALEAATPTTTPTSPANLNGCVPPTSSSQTTDWQIALIKYFCGP